MKAKEMFEKLGYEYFNNGERITYENEDYKTIEFRDNKVFVCDDNDQIVAISLEELKAINKQIEELNIKGKKQTEFFDIDELLDTKDAWDCFY